MPSAKWAERIQDGDVRSVLRQVRSLTDGYVRSIKSRRLSLGIQDSEEFRSRVVICSTQSDYLLAKIQERSSRLLDVLSDQLSDENLVIMDLNRFLFFNNIFDCLEVFICNMVAAEDLLYLCTEEDWKLAGLSVFLPASRVPCHSRFALLARDLDWTYYLLLKLLEAEATDQLYKSIGEALTDASNQDRSVILHKLEGGPSEGSVDQEVYRSLLRKRFEGDASSRLPGSVPHWCWIPVELKYTYAGNVASSDFKMVLKCEWLELDVAIAVYTGEHAKTNLEAEVGILARVQHPNVVSMFGCAYDENKEEGYLVTELMEQDLRQLIKEKVKSRGDSEMPFSLSVARDIILQIVEAMIHVHKCRVLHRDLKPANCLVSARKIKGQIDGGETYYTVKVIDFGASKLRGADESTCITRKRGTTAYMAPEVHAKKEECAYKWPADVYSLGMTMYEIFTGKSPFQGECTRGELERRVCAGERPWGLVDSSRLDGIPYRWKALMQTCCYPDPKRRPSFASIRLDIARGMHMYSPYRFEYDYYDRLVTEDHVLRIWQRTTKIPSELVEEFLENVGASTVKSDGPAQALAHFGLLVWNNVKRYFIKEQTPITDYLRILA